VFPLYSATGYPQIASLKRGRIPAAIQMGGAKVRKTKVIAAFLEDGNISSGDYVLL